LGGALGGLATEVAGAAAARRLASPGYQAGLTLRDMRIPVNQLAASMQPIPQNRAVVPYEAPVEVLGPGEGPYRPNFVMQPNEYARVVPGTPEAPRNMLGYDPNVPVQGQPGVFDIMRQRERDLSMRQGMAAEQQAAAAEAAAPRQPTRGGQAFELDSVTGRLVPVDTTLRGATPDIQIIESTGKSLSSAADILSSGKSPALMSAEQRIAWEKTKVDLAEAVPGMKALSDKALATKMMDRVWLQETIDKVKQKAQMQADIAARSQDLRLRQAAMMEREKLQSNLEMLEEQFRKARPVKTGGQGPKTRAFQRNMLTPEQEIQNALAK
jgi:hypothetical protein